MGARDTCWVPTSDLADRVLRAAAMTMLGSLALAYLVATPAFQVPPWSRRFQLLDRLGILPRWKFFTQGGSTFDVALEMRERSADGQLGAWRRVEIHPPHRAWHWLWYPGQHRAGIGWTALFLLHRRVVAGREAQHGGSLAYATILNLCLPTAAARAAGAMRQFALVEPAADGRSRIVFLSDFHPA